jgi:hypothetical protein
MAKRVIPIRRIIHEIRSGMGDVPIMEKYSLAPEEYMEILQQLKRENALWPQEPPPPKQEPEPPELEDQIQRRTIPRCYMVINRAICDAGKPSIRGIVTDITEKGVQVVGLQALLNEVRAFSIGRDRLSPGADLQFEAVCRWVRKGRRLEEWQAGFEITKISSQNLVRLRKLIQELTFCESGFQ